MNRQGQVAITSCGSWKKSVRYWIIRPACEPTTKEYTGRAMLTWAHQHGVSLRPIEVGKPNQNAYDESFNGRLRDGMSERALVSET